MTSEHLQVSRNIKAKKNIFRKNVFAPFSGITTVAFFCPGRTSRRKAHSFHLLHLFCIYLCVYGANKCNAAPEVMPGLYWWWLLTQASHSCPQPGVAAVGRCPRPSVQHRVQEAWAAQPAREAQPGGSFHFPSLGKAGLHIDQSASLLVRFLSMPRVQIPAGGNDAEIRCEFCIIQYPVFLATFHLVRSNQDCTEAGCLEATPSLGPPARLVLTPYLPPLLRNRVDLSLCQKKILARYAWTVLTASISECRSWRQSSDNHRNTGLAGPSSEPSSRTSLLP